MCRPNSAERVRHRVFLSQVAAWKSFRGAWCGLQKSLFSPGRQARSAARLPAVDAQLTATETSWPSEWGYHAEFIEACRNELTIECRLQSSSIARSRKENEAGWCCSVKVTRNEPDLSK